MIDDRRTHEREWLPRWLRLVLVFGSCFALTVGAVTLARANGGAVQLSGSQHALVKVAKGKPRTVRTNRPFYEIVIGDPDIANVTPLTDRSFYVLGNELGTTGIALFDENRQPVGTFDVEVTLDTDRLASTIRSAVPGSDIRVDSANGRLILSGQAEDAVAAEKARNIATRFSGEEEIINSVDIASSQQVQLNVRFVEINRQIGQELGSRIGANFWVAGGSISVNGGVQSSSTSPLSRILDFLENNGSFVDVAIKALEDRGLARRLAEPNLIARSGERASFLAGGEFPIPVPGEDSKVTIEYKKYGVSLDFLPTVLKDGLIALDIEPEVSSIDPSASYRIGDLAIPGFAVRRARTSVDLKSGQSFMIAGLLQTQNDQFDQRLPGIGRLPIIGALFSSKAYQRRETDLVIIITPHLVKPMDPTRKPRTPLDTASAASNVDYFIGNIEEVRANGQPVGALAYAPPGAAPLPAFGHFLDLE